MRKPRKVGFERIALTDAWARLPTSIRLALMHLWQSEEDAFAPPAARRDPGRGDAAGADESRPGAARDVSSTGREGTD